MRYYIGVLFFCFILVSCNRGTDEVIILSNEAEAKIKLNENIFYGINSDPNFYISNNEYTVIEHFQEAIPAFGLYKSFYSLDVSNDDFFISIKNNALETVFICNKTNEHPLGEYIGRNINEVKSILGKEDWSYNSSYNNEYLYFDINEHNDYIRIATYDTNDENIIFIEIGVDNYFIKKIWGLMVDE
jgi:hypothetical protein